MTNLQAVIVELQISGLPTPTPTWVSANLPAPRPGTTQPHPKSLVATVRARLLNSDITQRGIFEPSAPALPPNLSNPSVKERRLPAGQGILVQVLEVEDTSRSRWEQIESIEAEERGEKQVGRELIRDVPTEEGENGVRTSTQGQRKGKSGPHKLLLEDCKGQKVYGFSSTDVPKVDTGMFIGTKLLLKGCTVARGMVLLEPGTVTVVGGKIEELHGSWVRHRKEILRKGIESNRIDDST